MFRTMGRIGWLAAAVLGVCVLSAPGVRPSEDDKAALHRRL